MPVLKFTTAKKRTDTKLAGAKKRTDTFFTRRRNMNITELTVHELQEKIKNKELCYNVK